MANLIVALLTTAGVITAVVTLLHGALAPQGELSDSWKSMRTHSAEMVQTEMSALGISVTSGGQDLELTVRNDGQTPLREFDKWDLIVAYDPSSTSTGLRLVRPSYTEDGPPGADHWTIGGIYLDATGPDAEVFGLGVADPGEEFVVQAKLGVPIGSPSANAVTLAATNGVTVSSQFAN